MPYFRQYVALKPLPIKPQSIGLPILPDELYPLFIGLLNRLVVTGNDSVVQVFNIPTGKKVNRILLGAPDSFTFNIILSFCVTPQA